MNANTDAVYRVSAKALIENADGGILLVKERDGRWELPGGGMKSGEDARQTLEREIEEELGVGIERIDDRPACVWTRKRDVDGGYDRLFLGYRVQVKSENFIFRTDEAVETSYFLKSEMKSLRLHSNILPFVENGSTS